MSKENFPKISVITPHYQSKTVFASIDSVLQQSYPDIQYIIVVDGHYGFSAEKIEQYLSEHAPDHVIWHVIGLDQNMGTVAALNRALPFTRGEYIFNLADDDVFMHPDVLLKWTEYMQKKQSLICTAKRCVVLRGSNRITVEPTESQIKTILSSAPAALFEDLAKRNYVLGSCTAQSRVCFEKFGQYDPQYRLTEDYPRVMKLLRNGVCLDFFPEEVVRCGSNGTSSPIHILNLLNENEAIFQNEILPYCVHPLKTKIRYWVWKVKTIRHGKFLVQYEKNCSWHRKILIFLRFPENLIRAIREHRRRKKHDTV